MLLLLKSSDVQLGALEVKLEKEEEEEELELVCVFLIEVNAVDRIGVWAFFGTTWTSPCEMVVVVIDRPPTDPLRLPPSSSPPAEEAVDDDTETQKSN